MSGLLPPVSTINSCESPSCSFRKLAVITYDTILTLPQEIDLLWGRKFRLAALLYIMARYSALITPFIALLGNTIFITTQAFMIPLLSLLATDIAFQSVVKLNLSHAWSDCVSLGSAPTCIWFKISWPC